MLLRCNDFDSNGRLYEDTMYDKSHKIHYRIGGRDDTLPLTIKVCLTNRNGYADEKALKISITDDKNPLFLYTSEIDSHVYAKLKQKLGLLIDFAQFPNQFISLLEQCDGTDGNAKYIAVLEETNADPYDIVEGKCSLFKIMEINRFQRLCLIALHVVPGSETEVNALMARNLVQLKRQMEQLEFKCRDTEKRYHDAEEKLRMCHVEMEQVKMNADERMRSNRQKYEDEITALKHHCELIQRDCEKRIRKALGDQEETHKISIASLEATVEKCKAETNALKNLNERLEAETKERNERLDKLHSDLKIMQDEILKAECKISRLEAEAKEKNVLIASLKQRYSHLERERDDKEKAAKKLNSLLEASESSKNYLKNALKEKFEGLERKERDLASVSKDLLKANEIIAKMNKEISLLKQKLTERNTVANEQRKSMDEFQHRIDQLEKDMEQKNLQINTLQDENTLLKSQLKDAQNSINIKEELIRKNERIIGWLNDIVGKQDAASRPHSSSSKFSALSSLPESTSNKTSSRKPLNEHNVDGKATQAKKTTVSKPKPDFRVY